MSTADDDAFDAAITVRANAYAHRAAAEVLNQIDAIETTAQLQRASTAIETALARAFVVGLAAGIEVERGPVTRRPSRGRARR